jgi:hypothetical protein
MMHHFGGGYSDIKPQTGSWRPAFETLGDAWISGYHEECEGAIACPEVRHAWTELPGNGAYICKPRTPLTEAWFGRMHALLDERLALVAHQALLGHQGHRHAMVARHQQLAEPLKVAVAAAHAVGALLPIGQKVPGAHVNCVGTDAPYTQK